MRKGGEEEEVIPTGMETGMETGMGVEGTRYSSSNTVLTACERNTGLGVWGEVNREPGAPWVQSYCITLCSKVVSESLLYSLSQENAERKSMVASIYV